MKYAQFTFQPMSSPTNVTPRRVSTVTTSPSRIAASFDRWSPGSARDHDPERPEVSRHDRGVRVEIDRVLVRAGRHPEPAADVHLDDVVARRAQPLDRLDRRRERPFEAGSPSRSQPEPAWKWTVSTARSWRAAISSASSSRSSPTPNFIGRAPLYSRCSLYPAPAAGSMRMPDRATPAPAGRIARSG